MKEEYSQVASAMEAVRGMRVWGRNPKLEEIQIETPTVIRQGNKYGVKIKSKSPSVHMIKANIETEIAPIVGTEEQAKDLISYIQESGPGREYLGDKYFRKIHRTAGGGRDPHEDCRHQ